jgi:hypothetical protein
MSARLTFEGAELVDAYFVLARDGHAYGPPRDEAPIVIDAREWLDPTKPTLEFDRRVHEAEDQGRARELYVRGDGRPLAAALPQIASRYQRLWPRRNRASADFDAILHAHRMLHDLSLPLVRADYEHALDVWQWTLRLDPSASRALQAAALFHDVERLRSEALERTEHRAKNYLAFKNAHARGGAQMAEVLLAQVAPDLAGPVVELIERHEQPGDDPELRALNDADALSFFSLNSAGFLAYYGIEHLRKKVRFTLDRISSPRARSWLPGMRLEPAVREALAQA